ncbi:CopY/TcrY family copper transport repressor [Vagococcus entomophilus]|nr:CopY/TcrY family copper transport repressor [Vagococcus entomophilus]
MKNERISISDAEWKVMRTLWTNPNITSQQLINLLSLSTNWKAATIKTLLGRLVKKNFVVATKSGSKYTYMTTIKESETIREVGEEFLAHICRKQVGKTIVDWIQRSELSFNDIEEIQQALTEKKADAVEEVMCHCEPGQCHCCKWS